MVEGFHPPLQLRNERSRDHDVPVLPRLRLMGLEPDEPVVEVQVRLLQAGQLRDPEAGARQELDDEPVPALKGVDERFELGGGYELGNHGGGEGLELIKS